MPHDSRIRFATDLCTFYDPRIWGGEGGYADIGSLFTWGTWDEEPPSGTVSSPMLPPPASMASKSPSPGDWTSALRAFGTAECVPQRSRAIRS